MNTYIFQREYSEQEKAEFYQLLQSSIDNLPNTLSVPVERFVHCVEKEDYHRALNYAIDFFEVSVQYLSCILIALIQKKDEETPISEKHKKIIQAIKFIDNKRPLSLGDWVNEIFYPLLETAKDRIAGEPLTISLNEYTITRKGKLLTGSEKLPKIIQIRNNYRGHSTTLSEEIYKGVVSELEPSIFLMLKAVAPLREWTYFSCKEQTDTDTFRVNLFKGNIPNQEKITTTFQSLLPLHYYIGNKELRPIADIFPLIFCDENNYVYVLQTLLNEEKISFISSNINAKSVKSERWNEALNKRFQKTVSTFDVAKELNRDEIKQFTDKASQNFLEHAYKEKKYNQELFVDRSRLSSVFQDFQSSDKTLFPLLGEAGQGKTNQLCYWTEKLIKENTPTLILNSSGFAEITLEEKLKDIFETGKKRPIKKLLDNVHQKIANNNENIYFFFDAINECLSYRGEDDNADAPLKLYHNICSLLINEDYPCFKVLFTCRSYTWKNLIQPQIQAEDNFTFQLDEKEEIVVHGFTNDELEKAYDIYSELYQMNTPFSELSKNSTIRLKDPLVLKIACTNYLGMELPSQMLSYTSISLFEKMLQDISRSYAGNKQRSILEKLSLYILQEYENGHPTDSISEEQLREAYKSCNSQLHEMAKLVYKKDDTISVAYGELLNKPERPILRLAEKDDGARQLQFIFERFLEFMLAKVFVERERNNLPEKKNISSQIFVEKLQNSATNVVFMGAMRNALIMDYMDTGNSSVILELISKHGDNSDVMLLISETFIVLIRENYETEIFALVKQLLDQKPKEGEALIQNFNAVYKKIESNQADPHVINEHIKLSDLLAPVIRLRKLASVSVINGIFLTDYFNEGLYQNNPFQLLWTLMTDPLIDVRNDACLYVYLLANKTHTTEYFPIKENLTQRIIKEMYNYISNNPVLKIAFVKQCRNQSLIFAETAGRLSVLLAIDAMMSKNQPGREQVNILLNEFRTVVKHLTLNFILLKLLMPFFMIIIRRQVTFQSMYVNNIIEYQTFWDDKLIPVKSANDDEWSRENLKKILIFIFHYIRYYKNWHGDVNNQEIPDFSKHQNHILSAYKKGDSYSYFILERILVIMGTCDYRKHISPVVNSFFTDEYRQNEWFDYSQMSMLYVLFQLSIHNKEANEEIIQLYSRESEDWTRRCRGLFKGHNSEKANPTGMYKRNVMSWYCVVYCYHTGDAVVRLGDEKSVPAFYKLLDDAINDKNKELLYHLLENISELVTDYGFIKTSLELIKYIMTKFDCEDKVDEFNKIQLERSGVYKDDLITLIGKVLSTAKNCFHTEVDNFIRKDMVGLKFPGVSKFRGEILNFNPSGESLSDLFTHRFGNFLMWSLLNEEAIDKSVYEILSVSVDSPNSFKWYDKTVRIIARDLFKIKL